MVVNLRAKKRLVSRITGVGLHRVRFDSDHLDDIADAITRDNIRSLITANTITSSDQYDFFIMINRESMTKWPSQSHTITFFEPKKFFRKRTHFADRQPNLSIIVPCHGKWLFVYSWNQYLWPLLITTEPDMKTIIIGVAQLVPDIEGEPDWHIAMAAMLLALLPPVIVVVALQRLFVKGLVEG